MRKTRTWKEAFNPSWRYVGGGFNCAGERLTSLEGAPSHVDGDFWCERNELTSLKGAPSYVGSYFDCSRNQLTSLEGAPSHVGSFFCNYNGLTSLKNIHLQIKHIYSYAHFNKNPITSHVLGLLLIEGLYQIWLDNNDVCDILNKHLPSKGMESVLLCQEELILAGFEEYAQL